MKRERNPAATSRLAALIFGMICCASAAQASAQPAPAEAAANPESFLAAARQALHWDIPAAPAHIAGPIYFVGAKGLSSYLIKSTKGLIVLNTGMPGSGPMIEASIRKLGFDPRQIKLLLANHAHVDHVGGHAHLQSLSGAEVAVIAEEKELIESGGKSDFHYGKVEAFHFPPVRVARVLHDGDVLEHGGIALTVMLTPGHTQGSTSFAMSIAEGEKRLSVLFPNGASINPGYRLANDPSYPGIADDFRRTLRVFESLAPDIWLSPHPETFAFEDKLARSAREGAAAWVDREGYKKWIAALREKFDATLASESNGN